MSGVQHLTVAADEAEQRLDRWFRKRFPQLNQGQLEKLCRKGAVRVDGGRVKASTRIGPGQSVRVPPLPEARAEAGEAVAGRVEGRGPAKPAAVRSVDEALAEEVRRAVIFRDEHMIVLDKPPGLAVQGGTGQTRHLGAALPALRFGREDDPRLVHRLDKDTSGVLVLARTGAAAVALSRAFRQRSTEKLYIAVLAGRPKPLSGTVHYGLEKAGGAGAERMVVVHPDEVGARGEARHARTDYRVIETAGTRACWAVLRPVTGRTHQLRAHMAALGTPIAGDGKYGGRSQENEGDGWGASLGQAVSRKLHLHAWRLTLPHPATGARRSFSAPLPEHMARTWSLFAWDLAMLPDPVFPGPG
ncbi:MAG: RluA family pseudouridine synthase [Pseudomonadota bacterium]